MNKKYKFEDLKTFNFGSPTNLDQSLSANGLVRRNATASGNNCLLDTIFQQISLDPNQFSKFVTKIRCVIKRTQNEQLSINDESEGTQIIDAVQAYLKETTAKNYQLELTVLLADSSGDLGYVDTAPLNKPVDNLASIIPIRMIVVNYNHYEPLFLSDSNLKFNFALEKANPTHHYCP